MAADLDRLRWRCRRGLLELDLVFGRFLDLHLEHLNADQRDAFARLLELPDNDLWGMVCSRLEAPDAQIAEILSMMR